MSKILQEKAQAIDAKLAEVKALYDQVGDGEPTTEQFKSIVDLNKTIEEMEHGYKEAEQFELGREATERRMAEMKAAQRKSREFATNSQDTKSDERPMRLGDAVFNDEQFKKWHESITKSGLRSAPFGVSPAVEVKTLLTGASSTSAGALIVNDRKPIIDSFYQRPLRIKDLITIGQTNSDTVEYVRVTGVTNNAATVAEATATDDGTGSKPESAMDLLVVSETVKIIAHWIPATRNALADAGQMRTMIDEFLRYGLEEELEDQIVSGGGTGNNMTGIYNTSNINAQTFSTDALQTIRKAITLVRSNGRVDPTAIAMTPGNWETIDLLKDNESRYFFGGPSVLGTPRIWGLNVVQSDAMTSNSAILGDWSKAVLWDRQQAAIMVSDSHSDFFVRNLIAVLAEMRAAFGVLRPKAFATVALA